MSFLEVRFPVTVSYGSGGGPGRETQIAQAASGYEERNTPFADARRRYNAGVGLRKLNQLHQVLSFFEECRGELHGFRWKDWSDYKSCPPETAVTPLDQSIGTGDGSTAAFQLVVTYGATNPYVRTIKKPVAGTVRVAVAGAEKTITTHFTVDTATGIVTFTGGNIPTVGQAITAGFEFDVPARFDASRLDINVARFEAGEIPSIPVVEIRV